MTVLTAGDPAASCDDLVTGPPDGLSEHELLAESAQALPDREEMSTVSLGTGNFAMPINEAFALNLNSTSSIAVADAQQTVIVGQVSSIDDVPEG